MPVEVIYKCQCMEEEQGLLVTDRLPNDDVTDWMNSVVLNAMAYHHRSVSPRCQSTVCEYARIPVSADDGKVGMQPALQ